MEPFSATLQVDPTRLRDLRLGIATWLENAGIYGDVRDSVVLATHEAAASAIERASTNVSVEAEVEGRSVRIVVESDGDWTRPAGEEGGQRVRVIRALVSDFWLEVKRGHARLRLEKRF
jgi:hypothetical protein